MKKYTLFLATSLLFVPSVVSAMVIEPGTVEIGGATQIVYSSSTLKDGTSIDSNQLGINAVGAYYVIPNLGVGANLSYTSAEVDDSKESWFSVGPVVKYSFPIAEQANVFALGSAGFYSKTYSDDSKADGWYASIGGGLSYFLSNSVSVDCLVKYEHDSLDFEGENVTMSGFLVGAGLSVYLR